MTDLPSEFPGRRWKFRLVRAVMPTFRHGSRNAPTRLSALSSS